MSNGEDDKRVTPTWTPPTHPQSQKPNTRESLAQRSARLHPETVSLYDTVAAMIS